MNDPTTITVGTPPVELGVGDRVRMEVPIPRPAWWRLVALWRWWTGPRSIEREYTVTSVVNSEIGIKPFAATPGEKS
jgi:hypothetical protein